MTKAEVRQRTNEKDVVAAVHSSNGNGEAMWQEWSSAGGHAYINVGRKNRQKGSTGDPMTDTYKRVSGGQWPLAAKNRIVDTNNIRKTSVTNSAHIRESGYTSAFSDASANSTDRSVYYKFPVSTQRR